MTQKIIFFTEGAVVTDEEQDEIEAINAACVAPFALNVANASVPDGLGQTPDGDGGTQPAIVECDFVAGSVPLAYQDIPVYDPDNPPGPDLPDTQAILSDDDDVEVLAAAGSESLVTAIASVSDNAIVGVRLGATVGIVNNGQSIPVDGGTVTISVTDNAVTAAFEPE